MKSKKIMCVIVIICLIAGFIWFDTHYAVINKKIYRNDIKTIEFNNLTKKEDTDYYIYFDITNIREVNKCTELEEMRLSDAKENTISQLKDFPNLRHLKTLCSSINRADIEKINSFNLDTLFINTCYNIDFEGFNSDTISGIRLFLNNIKNFETLAECKSLKDLSIIDSTISDYITEENFREYVVKDSSIFASFDYVETLDLDIDRIEDISGILEMDSLKEFIVNKGAVSEDNIKLLEDKGISVIEDE